MRVKPAVWPEEMDKSLLAKSAEFGGETLAEHTWDVLSRLADQYRLRPLLAEQLNEPRLWTRLFWACFLHDFGKAAAGFQQVLRHEREKWEERHEVLSLAFVEWLFPPNHPDYAPVIAIIAAHHKDFETIEARYIYQSPEIRTKLESLTEEISVPIRELLWQWLAKCGEVWLDNLGMREVVEIPELLPLEQAQSRYSAKTLWRALATYQKWFDAHSTKQSLWRIHLRGLILTADHAASGHSGDFPALQLSRDQGLGGLKESSLHHHQQQAGKTAGSAIMIAPTGSGKTEAALLWAAHQMEKSPAARLFYVLPYQASMNAMYNRLQTKHFPGTTDYVGLQHGHALQGIFYDLMVKDGITPAEAAQQSQAKRELGKLYKLPVRVFSPYEMLKVPYGLKGFEAQLVDYYGGLFIFDEIHAYEPKRLALIVRFMQWLNVEALARFLVMTATLPPMVREVLQAALPGCAEINADNQTFEQSRRHRVRVLEGNLLNEAGLAAIEEQVRAGKSTLVCLNLVRRAREAHRLLQERLADSNVKIILVHGRFNARDRKKKEDDILSAAGVEGRENRKKQKLLVIATQVVEVSLNIDMDTLFSDPAPLEALLQRFGRVNRRRPKPAEQLPLADVHVFSEPTDFSKVYDSGLVAGALTELRQINDNAIDESQVNAMLGRIYGGEAGGLWRQEFNVAADEFEHAILSQLRPFQSASLDMWKKFHELFDGVEVLPIELEGEYNRLREDPNEGGYIAASSLLVPLAWGQFMGLHQAGGTYDSPSDDTYPKKVDVPYNAENGLDLEAVWAEKKRQNDSEDY